MALLLFSSAPAIAADLRVVATGLRSAEGQLLVAVCPEADFTTFECPHVGIAPTSEGAVVIRGVPPGTYAVQAIHDENGNGMLDRRLFRPTEGMAFSRDAPMRRGPPQFGDAALAVTGNGTISVTMRYFQ